MTNLTDMYLSHARFCRPGDLARIDEYGSDSSAGKKSGTKSAKESGKSINGVVYKANHLFHWKSRARSDCSSRFQTPV